MKIAVIDLASHDGGALTITKSLFEYVVAGNAPQHEWFFMIARQNFDEVEVKDVKVIRFDKAAKGFVSRIITEYVDVNRSIRKNEIDVVVCMSNMCILGCPVPQFVYLHQSVPFQSVKNFSFLKKLERRYAIKQHIQGPLIKRSISNAKAVFVQTEWMKNAVFESVQNVNVVNIGYPLSKKKGEIISSSVPFKDFFYPCGPAVYKNIPILLKAVEILRNCGYSFHFYITLTKNELESLSETNPIDYETFVCLGKCPYDSVQKMYQRTTLVFPSYIESLGLPLIEAREIGTWIIASDCPFSHEILDSYSSKDYFNPFDANQLVEKMKRVLDCRSEFRDSRLFFNRCPSNCWKDMILNIEAYK